MGGGPRKRPAPHRKLPLCDKASCASRASCFGNMRWRGRMILSPLIPSPHGSEDFWGGRMKLGGEPGQRLQPLHLSFQIGLLVRRRDPGVAHNPAARANLSHPDGARGKRPGEDGELPRPKPPGREAMEWGPSPEHPGGDLSPLAPSTVGAPDDDPPEARPLRGSPSAIHGRCISSRQNNPLL